MAVVHADMGTPSHRLRKACHALSLCLLLAIGCLLRAYLAARQDVSEGLREEALRWRETHCLPVAVSVSTLSSLSSLAERLAVHNASSSLLIITYADENILHYAQHSLALVSLFARLHGHGLRVFTPHDRITPSPTNTEDVRWTKVRLLHAVLSEVQHTPSVSHVVWADADVLFLDLEHDLLRETLSNNDHDQYDLLLSSERHAETGVANTGVVIARNSAFARELVDLWLHRVPHSIGHDQIGFSFLYKNFYAIWSGSGKHATMLGDKHIAQRVRILPGTTLNSEPPAYLHQSERDRVLHLMGEHGLYRESVFKAAVQNTCADIGSLTTTLHRPQLGLDRDFLADTLLSHTNKLIADIERPLLRENTTVISVDNHAMGQLFSLREALLQQDKVISARPLSTAVISMREEREKLLARITRGLRIAIQSEALSAQRLVDLLNLSAMLGHDRIQELLSIESARETLTLFLPDKAPRETVPTDAVNELFVNAEEDLLSLLHLVRGDQRDTVLPMLGTLRGNRASHCLRTFDKLDEGQQLRCVAVCDSTLLTLKEISPQARNPFREVEVHSQLAKSLCDALRKSGKEIDGELRMAEHAMKMLKVFDSAIDTSLSLLVAEQQVKEDHLRLSELLVQGIVCSDLPSCQSVASPLPIDFSCKWRARLRELLHTHQDPGFREFTTTKGVELGLKDSKRCSAKQRIVKKMRRKKKIEL